MLAGTKYVWLKRGPNLTERQLGTCEGRRIWSAGVPPAFGVTLRENSPSKPVSRRIRFPSRRCRSLELR
jgi:hypothetical protein